MPVVNSSRIRISPTASLQPPLLVFSHSPRLMELFRELPETEGPVLGAAPDDVALLQQKLELGIAPIVVVDVRARMYRGDLDSLLGLLEQHTDIPWRLIALADVTVPRNIASRLFRLTRLFLDASGISPEPEALSAALQPLIELPLQEARPESYRIEAGRQSIETWTEAMMPVLQRLEKIARHDVTLLLVGETGTGKTTLARFMHHFSRRNEGPFQTIACGALPKDLIESELFGHARGAFTGAERSKIGRFEAASGGTLLMDEIDLLSPSEQAKLLRVIESGEYEMVGSTETRLSNARLIVASNVALEELMREERFRADLFYRLNVLQFRLPPLRERRTDILPLAADMIDAFCSEHEIPISEIDLSFLLALESYRWPGNLRELKHQLTRSILFAEGERLRLSDLSDEIAHSHTESNAVDASLATETEAGDSLADQVARGEREILLDALRSNEFKRIETAKALGISRVGLYKKMKKYNLLDNKPTLRDSA